MTIHDVAKQHPWINLFALVLLGALGLNTNSQVANEAVQLQELRRQIEQELSGECARQMRLHLERYGLETPQPGPPPSMGRRPAA